MIHTATGSLGTLPVAPSADSSVSAAWRTSVPVLEGRSVTLRELRLSDAPALLAFLGTEEVSRFISPPPTSVSGFERYIEWTRRERADGNYICFGIVPAGFNQAVGLIQVRQLNGSFETAEWGFALGASFWGSGLFIESARTVLAFVFTAMGTQRLEARSSVQNGRGNGALQKLGALREAVLRRAFLREGVYHDQILWSIVSSDWRQWMEGPDRATHH